MILPLFELTNRNPCFKIILITQTSDMFRVASENNFDLYADSVSEFIRKCIGDVVTTGCCNRAKLKARTTAFNPGKVTGNMAEYKQCSYSLCKAIKQVKCQYRDKVELQFNGSDV